MDLRSHRRLALLSVFCFAIGAIVLATVPRVNAQRPARGEYVSQSEYVSQNTCKLCHNQTRNGTQWDIWQRSPHARAYDTLFNEESLRIAAELKLETPPHETAACLRCHVTAYEPNAGPPEPLLAQHGVQCESCHGPGAAHVPDGRRYWMEKDESVDSAAHILRPNERTCVQCHRRQSPTWDDKRYTLADGTTTGFDFQQAFAKIAHPMVEPIVARSE